jgi:hypothetical protein
MTATGLVKIYTTHLIYFFYLIKKSLDYLIGIEFSKEKRNVVDFTVEKTNIVINSKRSTT